MKNKSEHRFLCNEFMARNLKGSRYLIFLIFFSFFLGFSILVFGAELFPYDPPSSDSSRVLKEKRLPSGGTKKQSKVEEEKIKRFVQKTLQLPKVQRENLKKMLEAQLDQSVERGDISSAKYYYEILKRIK